MRKPINKPLKIVLRITVSIVTALALLCAFIFSGVALFNYGPSETFRDLFVMSMMETSAAKFLATWFFSDDELQKIIDANKVTPETGISDPSLIVVKPKETTAPDFVPDTYEYDTDTDTDYISSTEATRPPEEQGDGIEVISLSGVTYSGTSYFGKLMIVSDPSRIFVGVSGQFGDEYEGKILPAIAKSYNAVAALNGGRFEDEHGKGDGGTPVGIVISRGEVLWGSPDVTYEIIGFNADNILIVGNMTIEQALAAGIRDAVSFGPILIMNGVPSDVKGGGGGLNPRSAIGQRADGALLLLAVDGRQPGSLGALYPDLIKIMQDYGAVNAANLDGGNSTALYYNGEVVNNAMVWYTMRDMPTCFIIK